MSSKFVGGSTKICSLLNMNRYDMTSDAEYRIVAKTACKNTLQLSRPMRNIESSRKLHTKNAVQLSRGNQECCQLSSGASSKHESHKVIVLLISLCTFCHITYMYF